MTDDRHPSRLNRRDFVRSCVGLMALSLRGRARAGELASRETHPRSRLVDEHQRPFRVADMTAAKAYLFHYPFRTTPCFLIDLGEPVDGADGLRTEAGESYRWPGGTGPDRSVVAFSAICAHKMTHPAKSVSFINYRPGTVTYVDTNDNSAEGRHLIYCCSERSVYDVRDGARVLGGPARQPLAAIALDYDPDTDALSATGTFGGEMFDRFFAEFTSRLQLAYGTTDVAEHVGADTVVRSMDEFTGNQVLC